MKEMRDSEKMGDPCIEFLVGSKYGWCWGAKGSKLERQETLVGDWNYGECIKCRILRKWCLRWVVDKILGGEEVKKLRPGHWKNAAYEY